ncbi:MAG: RNA polymerase sigma factor [Betaproteobacteria bacterium]|nr:MAG: RNA polymerase sigma factor [Betaproteobacteria bacterium]TMI10238.1 MAG: RNA polymerase sigma factor [Betaproteobacteria bacterium]
MPPVLRFGRTRTAASKFEDLLRPQVEYLYRLAWRFTGSVADAEDLVQDVLLKLYPRTRELLDIERLRPWLAKVLYRQYIDFFRKRARSPLVELAADSEGEDDPLDTLPALEDGPEDHAERSRLRERILAALERLSPEQRAVVTMHDVEGYSLEELETILETPLGTLKSRLHRARRRLRALLPMEPFSAGERVNS